MWGCCVLLFLTLYARPGISQVGSISFAQPRIDADEGTGSITPVQIPMVREGGTEGSIFVSIAVRNAARQLKVAKVAIHGVKLEILNYLIKFMLFCTSCTQ